MKARHHLSNDELGGVGESDRPIELVEAAKLQRIRTRRTKRKRRKSRSSTGPTFLGKIDARPGSNARHVMAVKRIGSCQPRSRTAAAAGLSFEITINLGADHIEHYSKSIAVDPNDTDPNVEHRRNRGDRDKAEGGGGEGTYLSG